MDCRCWVLSSLEIVTAGDHLEDRLAEEDKDVSEHYEKARSYTEPTKKALFALSLGRCYEPSCTNDVVQMAGDTPIVQVQIAHICAAKKGGPRYDERMTDDERRSFPNLLLLCGFHHPLVDRKPTGDDYSADLLREWKVEREGGFADDLNALTEEGLIEILGSTLGDVIGDTKDELLSAIKDVEQITGDNAQLLRKLVTETFNRPHLDTEAVAALASSASVLSNLPDYAPMLRESSRSLENLPDYAPMLRESSRNLDNLPDYAPMLNSSSQGLRDLPDYASMLQTSAEALRHLPDYAPMIKDSSTALVNLPDYAPMLSSAAQVIKESSERIERALDAAENLNDSSYASNLEAAVKNLSSASSNLTGNVEEMDRAARIALEATEVRTPDRWTYIRNGMIAGALLAIVVLGGIWYMMAHPFQ